MTKVYLYQKPDAELPDHTWQHETGIRLLAWALGHPNNEKLLHHNISHSDRWVAVSLSDGPVGVDVEVPRSVNMRVADKAFSEKERAYLRQYNMDERIFLQLWTLKESYGKAKKVGIAYRMAQVDLLPAPSQEDPFWQPVSCSDTSVSSFSMMTESYVLSTCILKENEEAPELFVLQNIVF